MRMAEGDPTGVTDENSIPGSDKLPEGMRPNQVGPAAANLQGSEHTREYDSRIDPPRSFSQRASALASRILGEDKSPPHQDTQAKPSKDASTFEYDGLDPFDPSNRDRVSTSYRRDSGAISGIPTDKQGSLYPTVESAGTGDNMRPRGLTEAPNLNLAPSFHDGGPKDKPSGE